MVKYKSKHHHLHILITVLVKLQNIVVKKIPAVFCCNNITIVNKDRGKVDKLLCKCFTKTCSHPAINTELWFVYQMIKR